MGPASSFAAGRSCLQKSYCAQEGHHFKGFSEWRDGQIGQEQTVNCRAKKVVQVPRPLSNRSYRTKLPIQQSQQSAQSGNAADGIYRRKWFPGGCLSRFARRDGCLSNGKVRLHLPIRQSGCLATGPIAGQIAFANRSQSRIIKPSGTTGDVHIDKLFAGPWVTYFFSAGVVFLKTCNGLHGEWLWRNAMGSMVNFRVETLKQTVQGRGAHGFNGFV
jgi:hypothetical protein